MQLNPFAKKEPTQYEMQKENMNFEHNEGLLSSSTHPQATDEQVYLDQQEKRSDLIKWQQDLAPDIQNFVHKIRREKKTESGWVRLKNINPIANETFIHDTVGLVELSTSKNLINSSYSETRVLTALKFTLYDFRCMLQENRVLYDIAKSDMHLIVRLFKNVIEPTYWRCWNNGERRYAGEFNKRVEVHTDQQGVPIKKGLFGMG